MGSEDHDRERVRNIIKRLLNRAVNAEIIKEKPNLYYDAAHQIEQLYDENEKLRRDVKTAVMGDSAELQDVKRENEKLRKAVAVERERCAKIADKFEGWSGSFVARAIRDADFEKRWVGDAIAAIRESGDE